MTKPGALTCTEAMVMHLPMVLVNTLPGQERANAMHMKNLGCAEWVKRGELADSVRAIFVTRSFGRKWQMPAVSLRAQCGSGGEGIIRFGKEAVTDDR